MKIVIRAGGVGTRLWPSSRQENPKQFQALVNDKSLIRNTVDRVKPLLEKGSDLFVSVNEHLVKRLKEEIPELLNKNIIIEPVSRNTGPAICLESCVLAKRFGENVIVASLPSDDYIAHVAAFCKMLHTAENFLEKNPDYIITPAVKPIYPDPGYSYIKLGKMLVSYAKAKKKANIFEVADWIEKPKFKRCKELIKKGKYFCHTGMYIWKLRIVLDLFRKFQPKMYEVCQKLAANKKVDYASLEKITVESAITLKTPKIAVIISDKIGWSDLGKWHIIAKMLPADQNGNVIKGKVLAIDTKNCLIYGSRDKLIATIGLDNMVVVQIDDTLLVCPKERSDEVKKIVEELEKRGKETRKYL